jgi:hypothetical protein
MINLTFFNSYLYFLIIICFISLIFVLESFTKKKTKLKIRFINILTTSLVILCGTNYLNQILEGISYLISGSFPCFLKILKISLDLIFLIIIPYLYVKLIIKINIEYHNETKKQKKNNKKLGNKKRS